MAFPEVMAQQCESQKIPIIGNAANHSDINGGWLDLTGEPSAPPPLPAGFTAKGYGAMAGCVVAALMGLITIVWYGFTDSSEEFPPPRNGTSSEPDEHTSNVEPESSSM